MSRVTLVGTWRWRLLAGLPLAALVCSVALLAATAQQPRPTEAPLPFSDRPDERPDFRRMLRQQAETDRIWQSASKGVMQFEKITYPSASDSLQIPAFVFQPLQLRGPRQHPALVWVHENIRGHLYEHYIPYVQEATSRGFVVIAPEYRGSIGYGKAFFDAIDYGGAEVTDVITAATVAASRYASVDPARIGVIGWSHGGLIALLAVFRSPATFRSAAAMVPVTNLFHRLARKGDRLRRTIDPHDRFQGTPSERPDVYRDRSPLFHVDKLQIPLLLHVADNDEDVTLDEAIQLVDALKSRKPQLADIKIYRSPPGGHTFDRRVIPRTWQPENTPEQRDSWGRVWGFLGRTLQPSLEPVVPAQPR
jgi:dipeptidyl aminopeptidase/acylaminoacyl peptidase